MTCPHAHTPHRNGSLIDPCAGCQQLDTDPCFHRDVVQEAMHRLSNRMEYPEFYPPQAIVHMYQEA